MQGKELNGNLDMVTPATCSVQSTSANNTCTYKRGSGAK